MRTAALGIPLILLAVWGGGLWLALLLGVVSALALLEFDRLLSGTGMTARAAATVGLSGPVSAPGSGGAFRRRLSWSALGLLYIPLTLGHLWLLRAGPFGLGRALGVLAVVWVSDSAQFFAGRAIGRHRLAPATSPGKTVEGLVAGLAAAALFGALGGRCVGIPSPLGAPVALAVAAAGVVGDLFESHLKRRAGRKDSGRILPGHGGVLDRFDSLLFAAPAAYWLLRFVA